MCRLVAGAVRTTSTRVAVSPAGLLRPRLADLLHARRAEIGASRTSVAVGRRRSRGVIAIIFLANRCGRAAAARALAIVSGRDTPRRRAATGPGTSARAACSTRRAPRFCSRPATTSSVHCTAMRAPRPQARRRWSRGRCSRRLDVAARRPRRTAPVRTGRRLLRAVVRLPFEAYWRGG